MFEAGELLLFYHFSVDNHYVFTGETPVWQTQNTVYT